MVGGVVGRTASGSGVGADADGGNAADASDERALTHGIDREHLEVIRGPVDQAGYGVLVAVTSEPLTGALVSPPGLVPL